ncbi:Endocytosis regulator [Lithohypha guttulata]|uniref:Endocytosis regulator n=1 Tax=Lithohypha guttulata TaxID=1690604 RepID=UPI002DE01453|nr:Endocytosis regulator [Lithohypha guttulata]
MDHILHPTKKDKKRDDSKDRDSRKEKKHGLTIRPALMSKDREAAKKSGLASPGLKAFAPGKFEMIMESPPAILHGSINYSSGALISGRLKLNVEDPTGELRLTDFKMVLEAVTTTKKPVSKDCKDCSTKHETLKEWKFLSEAKTFQKGRLPATTQSQVGSISYAFTVEAHTANGEKLTLVHPLQVWRAMFPGSEKTSIRIFPPTHLTGKVTMPTVVHPIGKFPVTMLLSGVVEKKAESTTRWRLKKMMWRIEENSKVKSTPCEKHKHKAPEGKAIQHTESKQLGNDELKGGWKTDFDTHGGEITLEFEASLATKPVHKATCDVDSQSGLEVRHNLVIELIVAEEFVPNKNTNLITPTGAARVLRMSFNLVVTERGGMAISWDDETPPMYENVPPSPPGYGNPDKTAGVSERATMEDYTGPDFEYVDLEMLPNRDPDQPPVYRQRDPADINAGLPMRDETNPRDSFEAGPSHTRQRLGGFRLDDLEAEPQNAVHRHESVSSNTEDAVDYGEGTTQ